MPELRYRGLMAALAVASVGLVGCAVPSMPSFPSLFGSTPNPASADSNAAAIFTPPANFECPQVAVRQGAGSWSISANPAEANALNLRYQVALGSTARECRIAGQTVVMKIGVQGRVIVGPAGGPGQLEVPLRFAVVQEGVNPKAITTKLQLIPVTIPPNDPNVAFSHVEDDISFPMPRAADIDSYVVYIGFDQIAAEEMDKKKKKPMPKPARPRRANTAQAPAR